MNAALDNLRTGCCGHFFHFRGSATTWPFFFPLHFLGQCRHILQVMHQLLWICGCRCECSMGVPVLATTWSLHPEPSFGGVSYSYSVLYSQGFCFYCFTCPKLSSPLELRPWIKLPINLYFMNLCTPMCNKDAFWSVLEVGTWDSWISKTKPLVGHF